MDPTCRTARHSNKGVLFWLTSISPNYMLQIKAIFYRDFLRLSSRDLIGLITTVVLTLLCTCSNC